MLDLLSLDDLLRNAASAQRLRLERALRPLDLSPAQFELLRQLQGHASVSGAALGRLCGLSPQTIGVVVENLEKKSLVRRSADPVNSRVRRIHITDAGASALDVALICAANAVGPPLVKAADHDEVRAVVRFLTKLKDGER